jgi:DNA helicase HerA-like ATPase
MPFLMLVEEAHNFCPERGLLKAMSSTILRTVASEGRKFGMGLCVVSQRPARIDKNVLSQCNTQVILKITNPNDLRAISQSIEGFSNDLEEEIKLLQPGVALIVGEVVEQPIIVNIRVKRSQHGGGSVDMIREPQTRKIVTETRVKSLIQRLFFR